LKAETKRSDTKSSPETLSQLALDYGLIEKALRFLHGNRLAQPSLAETAAHLCLSEFHFEHLFRRWAGISPKQFLQFLTVEYAKPLLRQSARFSGPGRLHDLFLNCEAVTPGTRKHHGKGVVIRYGIHPTPFGDALIAHSGKGLCALGFVAGQSGAAELRDLQEEWTGAVFIEDARLAGDTARRLFQTTKQRIATPFHLHLRGTNFQLKVWQALLCMPAGTLATYSKIAALAGCPSAARAVGTAIGNNPISYLIPCHRVICSFGTFGNYRWGRDRKQAMIGWEAAFGVRRQE